MTKAVPELHCRARFIYNHGQKPSLTFVTPAMMTSALHRMYPLLLIADATLSNIMWICEDLCLPFLHLLMVCSIVGLLCDDPQWSAGYIAKLWAGIMSFFFLAFSFAYYILTVYNDLICSEPPTLDDIVIVLESVVDKLDTIRHELTSQTIFVRGKARVFKLALILTPVQFICLRIISVKNYILGFTMIGMLFHSNWCQCTTKLFWRTLLTRKIYYAIAAHLKIEPKIYRNPVSPEEAIRGNDCIIFMALPDNINDLQSHKLQLQLQKLFPRDGTLDGTSQYSTSAIQVIDLQIQENQRKWQADGWTDRMLPYEKPKYCILLRNGLHACNSPWQFQESSIAEWSWLDDCWRPGSWVYSDTMWEITGESDSLESCTRARVWKRRIYRITKTTGQDSNQPITD
ncbi:PEX32 (YBR168W) [Zygosaccharomyces parabailii]|nr:PEX32 (YBR168W) [Zygosaccharomyces parabailii]